MTRLIESWYGFYLVIDVKVSDGKVLYKNELILVQVQDIKYELVQVQVQQIKYELVIYYI